MIRSATRIDDAKRERRRRRDELLRERGGDRDDLERRSRLVDVRDGTVAAAVGGGGAELVRIEAGRDGHREDAAVARVEHDRSAALRTPLLDRVAQDLLGVRLDAGGRSSGRRRRLRAPAWSRSRRSRGRRDRSPSSGCRACRSGICPASARALRDPCCRSPRNRARARRHCAAGSSAAPRRRSRDPGSFSFSSSAALAGSAFRFT